MKLCFQNSLCVLKRNFENLKERPVFDDELPILYPTDNAYMADLWIKVLNNGVPTARIPVHAAHAASNIKYFESMLRPDSCFRECDSSEIVFECPYKAELVRDYLASIYDPSIQLTRSNCMAFFWLADFMNDTEALGACERYLRNNMDVDILFEAISITDRFDNVCQKFLTLKLLDIDGLEQKIKLLPRERFKWMLRNCSAGVQQLKMGLMKHWLPDKHGDQDIKMILEISYRHVQTDERIRFYGEYKSRMSPELDVMVFGHIFGDKGISTITTKQASLTKVKQRMTDNPYVMIEPNLTTTTTTGVTSSEESDEAICPQLTLPPLEFKVELKPTPTLSRPSAVPRIPVYASRKMKRNNKKKQRNNDW